jgi:hypothetical protein
LNHLRQQIIRRAEEACDPLLLEPFFQQPKFLCACASFHVRRLDRVVIFHQEDQARDAALDGAMLLIITFFWAIGFGFVLCCPGTQQRRTEKYG